MGDQLYNDIFFNDQSADINQFELIHEPIMIAQQQQPFPKITIFDDNDNQIAESAMGIEEIRIDRLKLVNDSSEAQGRSGSDQDISRGNSQKETGKRRKSNKEEQKQLKERLQSQILLNQVQNKSHYTNKIQSLAKKDPNSLTVDTKNRQSRSQQKLDRKSEQQLQSLELSGQSSSENPDSTNEGNMDPSQLKQVRNRESARNSRARKKIYLEMLENRVKELQEECNRLREQCTNLTKSVETFNKHQDKFQLFLEQQKKLFEKLDQCLGKDKSEIDILLDALKYRTLSNKQERIDAAKSYLINILDVCLPTQVKYLFHSLENDVDFFTTQQNYSEILKLIFVKYNLQTSQFNNVDKFKQKLTTIKEKIRQSYSNIKKEIKNITQESVKVDSIWDQMKDNVTSEIWAQCLIQIQKIDNLPEYQIRTLFKKNQEKMQIESQVQKKQLIKKSQ